jgi:hypothetical protein
MEMMKEEIIEKYPSIKQDFKLKKDKKVQSTVGSS